MPFGIPFLYEYLLSCTYWLLFHAFSLGEPSINEPVRIGSYSTQVSSRKHTKSHKTYGNPWLSCSDRWISSIIHLFIHLLVAKDRKKPPKKEPETHRSQVVAPRYRMSGPNSLTCEHGLGFINLWLASENSSIITVLDCFFGYPSLHQPAPKQFQSPVTAGISPCFRVHLHLCRLYLLLCCMLPLNLEGNSLTQHPPNISSTLTSPKPFTWRSSCLKLKSTNRKPMVGKLTN